MHIIHHEPRVLAFIGMPTIGKTHWCKKLENLGYRWVECDDLIEQQLEQALEAGGHHGLGGVAAWLGMPHEFCYEENAATYLAHEASVLTKVLDDVQKDVQKDERFAISTTGSVVHLSEELLKRLRECTTVVYLQSSPVHQDVLFRDYVREPRPVIFGEAYVPHEGEEPKDAVKRCFLELQRIRMGKYSAIAHMTVPYEVHRAPGFTPSGLLKRIRSQCEPWGTYDEMCEILREALNPDEDMDAYEDCNPPLLSNAYTCSSQKLQWGVDEQTGTISVQWSRYEHSPRTCKERLRITMEPTESSEDGLMVSAQYGATVEDAALLQTIRMEGWTEQQSTSSLGGFAGNNTRAYLIDRTLGLHMIEGLALNFPRD